MGPSPMPEVEDGIDNDCNGVIDDVRRRLPGNRTTISPRAIILTTLNTAKSRAGLRQAMSLMAVVQQWGIPVDIVRSTG